MPEAAASPGPLLLTDGVSPAMNGRDTARRRLAARPGIGALSRSGDAENALVHGGVLEQGPEFLESPSTPDSLPRKVRSIRDRNPA